MRAKGILEEQNKSVPFELYNNIIVLLYELKQFEKAKKLSEELIAMTNELYKDDTNQVLDNKDNPTSEQPKIPYHQIVIQYNYARVLDELCEYKKARKIYRSILVSQPSFIEVVLCNALYLHRSGKHKDAINKFEEAANKAKEYNQISIQLDDIYIFIESINKRVNDMMLRKC